MSSSGIAFHVKKSYHLHSVTLFIFSTTNRQSKPICHPSTIIVCVRFSDLMHIGGQCFEVVRVRRTTCQRMEVHVKKGCRLLEFRIDFALTDGCRRQDAPVHHSSILPD